MDTAALERCPAVENHEGHSQSDSSRPPSFPGPTSTNSAPSLSSGDTASESESLDGRLSLVQQYALLSSSRSPSPQPLPSSAPASSTSTAAAHEELRDRQLSLSSEISCCDDASEAGLDAAIDLPDTTDILAEIGSQFRSIALGPTIPIMLAS